MPIIAHATTLIVFVTANSFLMSLICFCAGYSSCYSDGTYTWYLGYCFMQKVERLVALGRCNLTPYVFQYSSLGRFLLWMCITDLNSIKFQVADGDLPIVASHGWEIIKITITLMNHFDYFLNVVNYANLLGWRLKFIKHLILVFVWSSWKPFVTLE